MEELAEEEAAAGRGCQGMSAPPCRPLLSCHCCFQVESGGLLGLGTIDQESLDIVAMTSIEKYALPTTIEIDLDYERPTSNSSPAQKIWFFVVFVVMFSAFFAFFIGTCVVLKRRQQRSSSQAPVVAEVAPARDAVGPITVFRVQGAASHSSGNPESGLEQQARRYGPSGGL
jgi:hypothetical protein